MAVYAIRNKTTGAVKFGYSADPERRLKDLQTASDCELVLEGWMPEWDKKREGRLHDQLADEHIRGEWFAGPKTEARVYFLLLVGSGVRNGLGDEKELCAILRRFLDRPPEKLAAFAAWLREHIADPDPAEMLVQVKKLMSD